MKIVITSHGDLCEGILSSYQMIVGDPSKFIVLKLDENGINDYSIRLNKTLDELVISNQIIVLSDIVGGTPYNETLRYVLKYPDKVFLIAGLNLPMLIQAGSISDEETDIQILLNEILQTGQSSISLASTTIENDEELIF